MDAAGNGAWLMSRTARTTTVDGDFSEVTVGLVRTANAGLQVMIRCGDRPVEILADREALELSVGAMDAFAEKAKWDRAPVEPADRTV